MSRLLHRNLLGLAIVLCALIAASTGYASLIVKTTVASIGGGLFHYNFSITNNTAEDVVIVSITDAPTGDANISSTLFAPVGFMGSYDSGLGVVDFFEDTELFGIGTTKNGFSFDSATAPTNGFGAFEALTINGTFLAGQVQRSIPVPEPGTSLLLMIGLCFFVFTWVRRKQSISHARTRIH